MSLFSESALCALLVEPEQPPRKVWAENSRAGILAHIGATPLYKHDLAGDAACCLFGSGRRPNRAVLDANGGVAFIIYGPFLIAGRLFEDRLCSLCSEQVERYSRLFSAPHVFVRENNQIVLWEKSKYHGRENGR